jgi:protein-disulfide isomerase
MSNRQARREQSRQPREKRPQGTPAGKRPSTGRTPSRKSGGGGTDLFSLPYLLAVGALIIALAVVLAVVVARTSGGGDADFVSRLESAPSSFPAELAKGTKVGKDDAPVKLTEYEDFQCPFCLEYTSQQEPGLIEEFVKSGQMQIEYKHLTIIGPESVKAAEAAQCAADQDKFWQYHNLLFLTQAKAGQFKNEQKDVGRFSDANLKQFATDVGLDRTKFDQCYDSNQYLDLVNQQQAEAKSFGINGTPGFVINGTALGNGAPSDIDGWRKLVKVVLDAKNATPTAAASGTPAATASTSPAPAATATPTKAP